ncbi:NUDIX domain-containing protein [Nanchangia anserum]|uniref:8-oxo-dGTP diphosphatase n=1 Tax=Nanchangia anserum TaxID=2692125 RepID=A0A8I0GC11_9ACTO|nr:NUDIX domain-containing protein [Nanchangia anserum]MBD3689395.1 NUDIX domain-containing protein [Nanchangia anserum]QOX81602.1 NUDIX domain-containing protein [Nanchangia anserum]
MSRLIVAAIITGPADTVLASARAYPPDLAGRYEFPGGKVEPGEDAATALRRELAEELCVCAQIGPELANPDRADGLWPILEGRDMRVLWARIPEGAEPAVTAAHLHHVWQPRTHLADLDWLAPDLPIARLIARKSPPNVP